MPLRPKRFYFEKCLNSFPQHMITLKIQFVTIYYAHMKMDKIIASAKTFKACNRKSKEKFETFILEKGTFYSNFEKGGSCHGALLLWHSYLSI